MLPIVFALDTGLAAVLASAIAAISGIVVAALKIQADNRRDSETYLRELVDRLLTREEGILTPLVKVGENQQGAITTIGTGVSELLVAQKIEDGRRRQGGD